MDSLMVMGIFACAAIFAASFLFVSQPARKSKEQSEDLLDELGAAQERTTNLEAALIQARADYARQGGQMEALHERVRQHIEMNQALRDALAEADALGDELRARLITEVGRGQLLGDRLTSALVAMNDVSHAIIDMAERHRSSVQGLLSLAPRNADQSIILAQLTANDPQLPLALDDKVDVSLPAAIALSRPPLEAGGAIGA
jgi:hypothetical protein